MNKKDLIPVLILVALIPAWIFIDRHFIAQKFPAKQPAAAVQPAAPEPEIGSVESSTLAAKPDDRPIEEALPAAIPEVAEPAAEAVTAVLENSKMRIEFTSLGGGIRSATLLDYPEYDEKGSPPVRLDFSGSPALTYEGLKGIGPAESLAIQTSADGKSVVFSKTWNSGTSFHRTVTLGDDYLLKVSDRFVNSGPSPWNLPALRLLTGHMKNPEGMQTQTGLSNLGVDSYTPAGGINYWGRRLVSLFKDEGKPAALDAVPKEMRGEPVDWISAKNMFFTQIIRPADPIATLAVMSTRDSTAKGIQPKEIAAALVFRPEVITAEASHDLTYTCYIGPKDYSKLKTAGNHMEKVMEFETIGFWSWMNWLMEPSRKFLLWTMNRCHDVIPNYGIAIIILTILIRILFWPLTHKSTESMKRMQELQPEIKALQLKYKKDPPRLQQETMKLYKEKKVNPMGGCLPMFVQIPVFIALFTVLRNAIELRYAGFLWISDLSSPENLFAGRIPFVGSLNILPLLMSATMFWQQKITPTAAATPEQIQQQKIMLYMMPAMMLFFFYKMPSGLVLYWTTSQLLMILQMAIRNFRQKAKKA